MHSMIPKSSLAIRGDATFLARGFGRHAVLARVTEEDADLAQRILQTTTRHAAALVR